jgi:hypothetical protein
VPGVLCFGGCLDRWRGGDGVGVGVTVTGDAGAGVGVRDAEPESAVPSGARGIRLT